MQGDPVTSVPQQVAQTADTDVCAADHRTSLEHILLCVVVGSVQHPSVNSKLL
jgi:hypothetical protein